MNTNKMPLLNTDPYQKRYITHQKRKQKTILTGIENKPFYKYLKADRQGLMTVMENRRSRRIYSGERITADEMKLIKECAGYAPSSCDRKAIKIVVSKKGVESLVGGRGWIEKADKVILFYATELAYKSPAEKDFMHYLDTGFVAQNIYLICEVLNIKCCFVNPNRTGADLDKPGYEFCGATALGK